MSSDGTETLDDTGPARASRARTMRDEPASVTASRQLAEESRAGRGEGRLRQPLPGTPGRPAIRPLGRGRSSREVPDS